MRNCLFSVVLAMSACAPAWAQVRLPSSDVPGAQDSRLLGRYEGSIVVDYRSNAYEGNSQAAGFVRVSPPVAAHAPATGPVSSKSASKEQTSPATIDIGELVKGRLGDSGGGGGYHYWKAAPPAGKYRVVIDVKLANDQHSNLQAEIVAFTPDGRQLGKLVSTNEIDYRMRAVTEIDTAKLPEFVLRVGNNSGIVDYWLGVFPASGQIAAPYFVRTPKIEPLEFGKPFAAVLDPKPGSPAEAWYSVKLKGEDYKVAVEFTRTDGQKSNVQGDVVMFGPLGQRFGRGEPRICHVNEIDVSAKCVSRLVLSEDMEVLLRVAPNNAAGYRFVLTVEPHKEP
jgi:hypothetical protein